MRWKTTTPESDDQIAAAYDISTFNHRVAYPYADRWTLELLASSTLMRLHDADRLVVALWFTPLLPGSYDLHACVDSAYRGRWLRPSLHQAVLDVLTALGAHAVLGHPASARHTRIVERLGFVKTGPFHLLTIPKDVPLCPPPRAIRSRMSERPLRPPLP